MKINPKSSKEVYDWLDQTNKPDKLTYIFESKGVIPSQIETDQGEPDLFAISYGEVTRIVYCYNYKKDIIYKGIYVNNVLISYLLLPLKLTLLQKIRFFFKRKMRCGFFTSSLQ